MVSRYSLDLRQTIVVVCTGRTRMEREVLLGLQETSEAAAAHVSSKIM